MIEKADVIIIGAGAAGCVAAARISEDAACHVVLIEAGRDLPPGQEPKSIKDVYSFSAAFDPANHWPGLSAWTGQPQPDTAPRAYEQARLMGGGTSMNGQQASIGIPADYDDWTTVGAVGWGWTDVEPWFERLNGRTGVFPISTVPRSEWPPFSNAFASAVRKMGLSELSDPNTEFEDGWFALPTMNDGESRTSAAKAYLTTSVRARPNLKIMSDSCVKTIVIKDGAAIGVKLTTTDVVIRLSANRIVLAAGAIGSPLLLQRSGIGPGDWLQSAGIPVLHSRDGVGKNLQEHPSFALSGLLAPGQASGMTPRRHIMAAMRFSSTTRPLGPSDLYAVAVNRAAWHAVGWRIASLFGWINKPLSRGWVRAKSQNDSERDFNAEVALNMLDHPDDLKRFGELSRHLFHLMTEVQDQGVVTDFGLPKTGAAFRAFLSQDPVRGAIMRMAGVAVDKNRVARRMLLRSFEPAAPIFASDDAELATLVRHRVAPGWHPVGTCRMGPHNDPTSVVDPRDGSLHGLRGLHVVDASVMPTIPRANTALPTIMIAEKLSDAIRRAA